MSEDGNISFDQFDYLYKRLNNQPKPKDMYVVVHPSNLKWFNDLQKRLRCWDGGAKETCDCPDCGQSLIDCKGE